MARDSVTRSCDRSLTVALKLTVCQRKVHSRSNVPKFDVEVHHLEQFVYELWSIAD